MKTIRLLALLALSGIWLVPPALAAKAKNPVEERLIGKWERYQPGPGLVEFDPEHNVRFYLTRKEADKKGMRWIEAKWTLTSRNSLRLQYFGDRRAHTRTVRLAFKGEELWLTEKGKTSRYRRLKGEIPAEYN